MHQDSLKKLWDDFIKEYDEAGIDTIWAEQSQRFREFWENRIISNDRRELSDEEIDGIILILDAHGKGHTPEMESVAKVMIRQTTWREIFRQLKTDRELSEIVTNLFNTKNRDESSSLIDRLYAMNKNRIKGLTGKSATVICAFLVAIDPESNHSAVHLDDRQKLMEWLGIFDEDVWNNQSVGQKIVDSNFQILNKFNSAGIRSSARTISDFCYSDEVRPLWKLPIGNDVLGSPFDNIFQSEEEAQRSFELMKSTFIHLGVSEDNYEKDERIAITLPDGGTTLRFNFGKWAILSFYGIKWDKDRLMFVCDKKMLPTDLRYEDTFRDQVDGHEFVLAFTDLALFRESTFQNIFDNSLQFVKSKFAEWGKSPYRRKHRPELLRMVFDEKYRGKLLSEGIEQVDDSDQQSMTFTKEMALRELFLSENQFDSMLHALQEKQNIILQGAPGVGKTFVAKRLANVLLGSKDSKRVEMIQFHQSYSYEDFIQGFRPNADGHFELRYGIFHQFCTRAQKDEAEGMPYVFIIDEINRGNLSKIFGELMMLIEPDKRGREFAMPLTYSKDDGEKFYIPKNLYLIGMMNTADRSLAMVDYALRRRFRFITLQPEFSSSAFRRILEENHKVSSALVDKVVLRMNELNHAIESDTKNLGPGYRIGHSFFCPNGSVTPDESWYRRIIDSEIIPLIQEYWFDDDKKVGELRAGLLI